MLVKKGSSGNTIISGYIPAKQTVNSAKTKGLSVVQYVEKMWNKEGNTQKVIDNLEKLGVFQSSIKNILEIGSGTGRYLEKMYQIFVT